MQFSVEYDSEGHIETVDWHHEEPVGFRPLCNGFCLTFDKLVVYLGPEQAKELLGKLQAELGVKCSECRTFKECRPDGSPGNDSKPCDGFVRRPTIDVKTRPNSGIQFERQADHQKSVTGNSIAIPGDGLYKLDATCIGSKDTPPCPSLNECPAKGPSERGCFMSKPQPMPPENPPVEDAEDTACETDGICDHQFRNPEATYCMKCGYYVCRPRFAEATARETEPSSTLVQGVHNALQATNDIVSRCGVLMTNLTMVDRALDKEGKTDDG